MWAKTLQSKLGRLWLTMIVLALVLMVASTAVRVGEMRDSDSIQFSEEYQTGKYVVIHYPRTLRRGGVPEPGQPLSVALRDAKGAPLSGDYSVVFGSPNWLELVDKDGRLISGPHTLYPGKAQSKVFLQPDWGSSNLPGQGKLTFWVYDNGQPRSVLAYTIPFRLETPLGAFIRLATLVLFGTSPLLLAIAPLLFSLLYENNRKRHDDQNAEMRKEIEDILQEVKAQPYLALQRYLAIRSRVHANKNLDLDESTWDQIKKAHEPFEQKTGETLREAGNACTDGDQARCISILTDLALIQNIKNQDRNLQVEQTTKLEKDLKTLAEALGSSSVSFSTAFQANQIHVVAYPNESGSKELGQVFSLALRDKNGMPLSDSYYAVFRHPKWMEIIGEDGHIIKGNYPLSTGNADLKVTLRSAWVDEEENGDEQEPQPGDRPIERELCVEFYQGSPAVNFLTYATPVRLVMQDGRPLRLSVGVVDEKIQKWVQAAVDIMDGPYSQDAREIGLAVLKKIDESRPKLLSEILSTEEIKKRVEFHKQGGKELYRIAPYIYFPSFELANSNVPVSPAQTSVLKWLKKLEFGCNPFSPFTPSVDQPLFPATSTAPYVLVSDIRFDRIESIRAVVDYLHKDRKGVAIQLPVPIRNMGSARGREAYISAICREYADIWLRLIARYPFVFLFLEPEEQITLAELLCWAFGSLDTVILWMHQFQTDHSPNGKNVARILQNMSGLRASPSPSTARMTNWLCLRPPGIAQTFLLVHNDSTLKRDQDQVSDLIDMREDLEAIQVILKIFTPPFDRSFPYRLPVSRLEWITEPSSSRNDLAGQINKRFEDAAPQLGKTFESLFYPQIGGSAPSPTLRLAEAANCSVTRMFQIGNDLLLKHTQEHPGCANDQFPSLPDLYLSMREFNDHLTAWRTRI